MEQLICPNKECGAVDQFYTELKANNNVARCMVCDTFIKNIPYGEPTFFVGKYKGQEISKIEDLGYLKWAHREMNSLKPKMKDAIQKRIDQLEHLAK